MQLVSNLAILPLLLIAPSLVYPIARGIGIEVKPRRYSSIDGLRGGFLALFVFIHHASIWYYLTHRHIWGRYLYQAHTIAGEIELLVALNPSF